MMEDAEWVELMRDALDHIERVARNSRTQSRRDRWIEVRARYALEGRRFNMDDMPQYPKMMNREQSGKKP